VLVAGSAVEADRVSYLVLARKWRPSTFDEVVGQSHVTRTLKNAIELGRVAHALLFTGSRGVGKTSCARILAKALNCEHGPTTTPCGRCAACTEIINGTSVDVFEIDGASNNSVEQIREIRESVKFLPTRGKRKMYIIDEVHMLSTSAFNALLKTLEEPPEHVLFVFATTEPHKIPDTIISRCQRYDFKRIPERDIVDAIGGIAAAEGVVVESAALHHIAREARGGMRDSLSLLDQVIAFCGTTISEAQTREVLGIADRQVLHHLTAAVFDGDGQRALEIIDELFRFGLDLQKFAAEFVQHLRDLMVVKVCDDPERLVDVAADEVAAMAALVRPVDPARIHRVFNALLQGAEEVGRSPFPKLVLEMTLLRLCHQGATLPLAEVLGGLARLEARLGDAVGPAGGGDGQGGGSWGHEGRGGFDRAGPEPGRSGASASSMRSASAAAGLAAPPTCGGTDRSGADRSSDPDCVDRSASDPSASDPSATDRARLLARPRTATPSPRIAHPRTASPGRRASRRAPAVPPPNRRTAHVQAPRRRRARRSRRLQRPPA
jgi:DNA polymerase-3 subunit gamma/tau